MAIDAQKDLFPQQQKIINLITVINLTVNAYKLFCACVDTAKFFKSFIFYLISLISY